MAIEFENLEIRVANEFKEAFAELQMDIGELSFTNTTYNLKITNSQKIKYSLKYL